jgi:hypothetical protein
VEQKKNRTLGHPRAGSRTKNPANEMLKEPTTRPLAAIALLELDVSERESGKKKSAA